MAPDFATGPTLAKLARDLATGAVTARSLAEDCLARIEDPAGEGGRAFMAVDRGKTLALADAQDATRKAGAPASPFAGIPLAIKDLFDVVGEVTRAGSAALSEAESAVADAPTVARMRQAGFVPIGRTNMTEFAYSGLGLNPHYGDPRSPWRRDEGRVSGGSSSGSAVAIVDGMAHAALGTDTGGSCRIPAAFTGLVGLKPTARRIPLDGALPLSGSLDSIGPIARSVRCCATVDAILAGEPQPDLAPPPVRGLRFCVPTTLALDGMDDTVSVAFEAALTRLSEAGASVERVAVPEFEQVGRIGANGGLTAAESFCWHRRLLAEKGDRYDPRVAIRIRRGEAIGAADYLDMLAARRAYVAGMERRLAPYDALVMPTVPIVPPRIADLVDDAEFGRVNIVTLRNSTFVNMMDGCAISLPIGRPGDAPVGLTIACAGGQDARMLTIAAAIEDLFASQRTS